MPSGPIASDPAKALTLPEIGELLNVLSEKYDYVMIDPPPRLVVTGASIIAHKFDGVLLSLRMLERASRRRANL